MMDLEPFRDELVRLTATVACPCPSPMMHEIWLRAAAEAVDSDAAFEIIAAGDDTHANAFAAFRRTRSMLAPRLSLVGAEDLWLHSDVFYNDPAAAHALAAKVVERRLPAGFGHIIANSAFIDALKSAGKGKALVVASPVEGAPFLHFDDSWRTPEEKFSKKKRSTIRRRRRRLNERGVVTTEIIHAKPDETDALFNELVELEAAGWKGRAGTALACDARTCAIFRRYAQLASEAGILRFSFMRLDGKAIAARIGVECDGAFWGFKSGYDETLKDCAPGSLLFLEIIQYAANAGLNSYEFLGAMEPWIKEWATGAHPKMRLRYYPYNLSGCAALFFDAVSAATKRAKARLADLKNK